jgi:hypothetical protein
MHYVFAPHKAIPLPKRGWQAPRRCFNSIFLRPWGAYLQAGAWCCKARPLSLYMKTAAPRRMDFPNSTPYDVKIHIY